MITLSVSGNGVIRASSRAKKPDGMIEIKKAFEDLTPDEYDQILDAPVWISLMAAYAGDGVLSADEKAGAVKLAGLRTYTAPKSLREYYKLVDARFEERFDRLNKRLPASEHDKELYMKTQMKKVYDIMLKIDRDVAVDLEKSLASFYEKVFKSHDSFFRYFALPVISDRWGKDDRPEQ